MADKTVVSDIIERRNESRKWMRDNIYSELVEVNRALKCRTVPILKKDSSGKETNEVDKSRTNVCMPDLNIIFRRNVARMTAQPYRLNYIGGQDPTVADFLSALSVQQYERSGEQWHDRRVVMMGEAFGFGYSKLYYDQIARTMVFRKAVMKGDQVVYRDRASIMQAQGAPQDEINGAVQQLGSDMSDEEVANFMQKTGTEISVPTDVTKYEGPCLKSVFIGDLFFEPGVLSLDASDFVSEQYRESDLWLKKQLDLTYEDENGQEVKAFDPKAVADLVALGPDSGTSPEKTSENDLKQMFESAIGKQTETQIQFPGRLRPRKKFDIIEQHELGEDGRIWITWVSERYKDRPLGRMPQKFDLYGKYAYTELVPLPDMIGPHGDSTPRLLRFLHQMHNLTVAQNFDFITNIMKKFLLTEQGLNLNSEAVDRGWFKQLEVEKISGIQYLSEPGLPAGAFEREAQILQNMSMAEPSLMNTNAGTDTNPMAGKTATTAVLASKAADALTQFKLDGRNLYLKEIGQKKLWINQQMAQEKWKIDAAFWGQDLRKQIDGLDKNKDEPKPEWALSDRYGKTVAVGLDPLQIQEDFQVEPEAGSYLSVDDELNQSKAMQLQQVASANPGILDMRKIARFQLSTIRGIGNPDDYIIPEPDGPQPPPLKGNFNIAVDMSKMPSDLVNQLLPLIGLQPSEELAHRDTVAGLTQVADAANKLGAAAQPVVPPQEPVRGSVKQAEAAS